MVKRELQSKEPKSNMFRYFGLAEVFVNLKKTVCIFYFICVPYCASAFEGAFCTVIKIKYFLYYDPAYWNPLFQIIFFF